MGIRSELQIQNVGSWNALIAGYARVERGHEALNMFQKMQSEGISPDVVTFTCILKACGSAGAIDKGIQIHDKIVNEGFLEKDVMVGSALVDMYAKCCMLEKALKVNDELPHRSVISWCSLISGFAQQGQCHEALKCLAKMRSDSLSPDVITFVCILKACGNAVAIDEGTQIHNEIVNRGALAMGVSVSNALIDMYAKCGMLEKAQEVLEDLSIRDVVCWSVLIAGYARKGKGLESLKCFKRMQSEGLSPDEVTLLCVLSACCHAGLLDEIQMLHRDMVKKYGVTPNVEHHACMVMVYGYAGDFDKAVSVIKVMPSSDYHDVWVALLGGCRKWGNVELGILAFDQAVQLDDSCAVAYVLIANIFAAAGMQEDAEMIKSMRLKYDVV